MSYNAMLKHRCNLLQLSEVGQDGMVSHAWTIIEGGNNIRCFLDLGLIRPGKDKPMWTPEVGRADDRNGVLFVGPNVNIKAGQRINMLNGPSGVFDVYGAIDEIWTPTKLHHKEISVVEIGRALAKGMPTQ